jgi:hypothetical protein
MDAILIALLASAIIIGAGAAFLLIVRIGIWRQEHAGSLATRPGRLSAAIASRVMDLHATSAGFQTDHHIERAAVDHRPASAAQVIR